MDGQIINIIESADYASLTMLKDRITSGRFNIIETINSRIKEMEMSHSKYCPVCGNDICAESVSNYTIIFGPESFKKKASFCAVDCLTYFIEQMKSQEKHSASQKEKSSLKNSSTALEEESEFEKIRSQVFE